MKRHSSALVKRPPVAPRIERGMRIGAAGLLILAALATLRGPVSAEVLLQSKPAETPAPVADEETLLREACNYLQFTRAQVSQLLLIARGTHRRLRLLAKEEAERPPDDTATPEAKATVDAAREMRKLQVADEITAYVAPLMTRILSREQIALAWRLTNGEPPRFAQANPALLTPNARFAGRSGIQVQLLTSILDTEGAALMVRARDVDGEENQEAQERARANSPQTQLYHRFLSELVVGSARDDPFKGHFPQRVIESTDLAELLPAVEPLARRVFNSDRWLTELEDRKIAGPFFEKGIGAPRRPPLGTLLRVRDYRMERGLEDQAGRGPNLLPLGGVMQNGSYAFGPGQGLRLGNAGVTDHYALQFTFRAGGGDAYQKLVDFKDGSRDDGLYLYKGQVTFYRHADGGTPRPGLEHRLRIERNRHTRIVRGYLDFRPIFAFIDLDDQAVFDQGKGVFFVDDRETSGREQGPGSLRWLTLYGPPRR